MPVIRVVEADGAEHFLNLDAGVSLMEGVVRNDIPGLVAECGGSASCGTCRVYVDEDWRDKLGEISDMEQGMLEMGEGLVPGVRLSCQIQITDALDGLSVRIPASQF